MQWTSEGQAAVPASIDTKYSAPFSPYGRVETSTSNVNSLRSRTQIWDTGQTAGPNPSNVL